MKRKEGWRGGGREEDKEEKVEEGWRGARREFWIHPLDVFIRNSRQIKRPMLIPGNIPCKNHGR